MSKKNILTLSWAPRWRENPVYPDKQIHLLPSTKAASKNREYDYRFCFLRMMDECMLNCVRLFVTPWTVVCQASLSMEFSKQEYWSRLPFPSPRDLPDPGIEPTSPTSPTLAGGFFTTEPPKKPLLVPYSDSNSGFQEPEEMDSENPYLPPKFIPQKLTSISSPL